MNINNFDKSPTGLDLELNIGRNGDLATEYFEDSIVNLFNSTGSLINEYSRVDIYLATFGSSVNNFDLNDLDNYSLTKSDIKKLLVSEIGSDEYLAQEYNYLHANSYSKVTKQDLIDFMENYLHGQYLNPYRFYLKYFKPKFFIVSSCGYCQGDYVAAVIPFSVLDELGVNYKQKDFDIDQWVGKDIDHLCWDCPIYARLEINDDHDNEIYLDEYMANSYDYDKTELLAKLDKDFKHDKKELILEWLGVNLPDYV